MAVRHLYVTMEPPPPEAEARVAATMQAQCWENREWRPLAEHS